MRVRFSRNKDKVVFVHDDMKEHTFLRDFPAFLEEAGFFYVPAKPWVVKNVVNRLRRNIPRTSVMWNRFRVDGDVERFMNSAWKLLPIPESFKYYTKPMDFQEIALRFLYTLGSAGILLDPGMGKSKVILDYIALKQFRRSVIVCPKPLLFVWEDEIATHRPDLSYFTVTSTDWEAQEEDLKKAQVIIVNYSKVSLMKEHFAKLGIDFMHLDEALIKDPTSNRTKDITDLSKRISFKALGSGTLVNNSPLDIFTPVRFLEPSLVGHRFKSFRELHSIVRKNKEKTRDVIVGFRKVDEAKSALDSCCIVMTKEEWLKNLPPKTFHDIYVPMSAEQEDIYERLCRDYYANFKGEDFEIESPLVAMSKLYQVSNGFLYKTPDEEGLSEEELIKLNDFEDLLLENPVKSFKKQKRKTLMFDDQPKKHALRKLIKETIKERRCILWFNMSAEYEVIKELMEEEGYTYLTIQGGDNKISNKVRTFNNDPSVQFLICQAKAVNYGITVLGTTLEKLENSDFEMFPNISPSVFTQIFYSLNFSLEVFLQQQDRTHRLGQVNPCEYYRLISDSSVERRIVQALSSKMVLRRDVLVDIFLQMKGDLSALI